MQFTDIKPGIIVLTTSFGASICCVLPMTIVLLGLGSWRIHDGYDAVPNYSVSAGTARAGDGLLALFPPQESL